MAISVIRASVLAVAASLPTAVLADEVDMVTVPEAEQYYSGLQYLPLRRGITNLRQFNFVLPEQPADDGGPTTASQPLLDGQGSSAGGYVIFGGPATTTFLATGPERSEDSLLDGIEFGVNWRPDVSGAPNRDYRRLSRGIAGSEIDRVGVRADLTALLRDELDGDSGSTVWRVTGMLGSTSLSLLSRDEYSPDKEGGGLLWDVGVGWSSGAVSVNAGYQSAYSLDERAADGSDLAVLSFGADYALMPGLSIYGEFNVIGDPLDQSQENLDTVIILGTGVSF